MEPGLDQESLENKIDIESQVPLKIVKAASMEQVNEVIASKDDAQQHSTPKKRKSKALVHKTYSPKLKTKIINFARRNSNVAGINKFGTPESTLKGWMKHVITAGGSERKKVKHDKIASGDDQNVEEDEIACIKKTIAVINGKNRKVNCKDKRKVVSSLNRFVADLENELRSDDEGKSKVATVKIRMKKGKARNRLADKIKKVVSTEPINRIEIVEEEKYEVLNGRVKFTLVTKQKGHLGKSLSRLECAMRPETTLRQVKKSFCKKMGLIREQMELNLVDSSTDKNGNRIPVILLEENSVQGLEGRVVAVVKSGEEADEDFYV